MSEKGITIGVTVVQKLLGKHRFVKRKAFKNIPIGSTKNRNEQFENISNLKDQYLKDGKPVVSEFACDSIKLWWISYGQFEYPTTD